jgi:hypothetical protein
VGNRVHDAAGPHATVTICTPDGDCGPVPSVGDPVGRGGQASVIGKNTLPRPVVWTWASTGMRPRPSGGRWTSSSRTPWRHHPVPRVGASPLRCCWPCGGRRRPSGGRKFTSKQRAGALRRAAVWQNCWIAGNAHVRPVYTGDLWESEPKSSRGPRNSAERLPEMTTSGSVGALVDLGDLASRIKRTT